VQQEDRKRGSFQDGTEQGIGGLIEMHRALGPGPLLPIHEAQVVTCLRLAKLPVGLLVNFNVSTLRTGFAG
jgi:hypothetical protein